MYSRLFFLFLLSFAGFSCSENEPVYESKDANFETFNVEFNTFRMQTKMPSKFELSNGTSVQIPAEAFVDSEGEPAGKFVYVHYRECHDAAEMIAAGFVLHRETGEMQMAYETGGMFEIRATDRSGEPLFLAEEKEIMVRFASFAKGNNYAAYMMQEADNEGDNEDNQSGFLLGRAYAGNGEKSSRSWEKLYVPETMPNYRKKREVDSARRRIYKDLLADPFGKNRRKGQLNRLRTFKLKLNQTDVEDTFKTAIWEFAGSLEKTDPTLPENKSVLRKNWPHVEIVPADAGSPMLRFEVHKDLRGFRKGHEKAVTAVAVSPNYDYVLTGSEDLTVKLWDVSGHELLTLNHGSEVTDVAFSPDGKLIAAAGKNKLVRIWNLTGNKIAALRGHGDAISAARFSADGLRIITTGRDSTARFWNLTGRQLYEFSPAHAPGEKLDRTYRFTLPSYSPDGQFLLAGTSDGSVRFWNASQTELFRADHGEEVLETMFSPGGSRLYSLGPKKLKVWNRKGKMQVEIGVPENLLSFTPSPDNEKVIFLTLDDSLTAELRLLPDGKTIPTETTSGGKHLLNLTGHSRKIRRAAFSDNGSLILTASDDKSANLYDLSILTKPENTYFVRFYDEFIDPKNDTLRLLKFSCTLRLLDRKKTGEDGSSDFRRENTTEELFKMYAQMLSSKNMYQRREIEKRRAIAINTQKQNLAHLSDIHRVFRVKKTGVYAAARPFPMFESISCKAEILTAIDSDPATARYFLLTGESDRVVIEYRYDELHEFHFNPLHNNYLMAVYSDGSVAVFGHEDFQGVNQDIIFRDKRYAFDLSSLKKVSSVEQLRQILNQF